MHLVRNQYGEFDNIMSRWFKFKLWIKPHLAYLKGAFFMLTVIMFLFSCGALYMVSNIVEKNDRFSIIRMGSACDALVGDKNYIETLMVQSAKNG